MFAVILFAGLTATGVAQVVQDVQPAAALCSPPIKTVKGQPYYYVYDFADELVQQGKNLLAARAYYQAFRCGSWTPLDPRAVEANMLVPFDLALRRAAAGKFVDAASRLNNIVTALPRFGDARYLMGVFEWSAGMHAKARATWRSTLTAPEFAWPDDYPVPAVIKAKRMLRWSATRR